MRYVFRSENGYCPKCMAFGTLYYIQDNWNAEQKEIREYFDGLDTWIEITVNIPASKRDELIKFAESLKNK